jgi:hypothetical protein
LKTTPDAVWEYAAVVAPESIVKVGEPKDTRSICWASEGAMVATARERARNVFLVVCMGILAVEVGNYGIDSV